MTRSHACLALCLLLATQALFAQPAEEIRILNRDPEGNGLLCRTRKKTVLIVSGTPEQMGRAHGRLMRNWIHGVCNKTAYLVGMAYSVTKDDWFFERMDEVMARTKPHTPERFLREIDAMSKAAGISERDGRVANFFPEMFHCSGFAVRNSATKDGRILHARVLDYMRDIHLQTFACVQVYLPSDPTCNAWMSLGYAGFVGTVTAMNEKGLAIGEMGGGGEGNWDGMPMNLLLREVMERAGTVDEAVKIIQNAPRTCEYYYVVSDKQRNMVGLACTPEKVDIFRPGSQDARLPHIPKDTVMLSGGSRAKALSERLTKFHGQIDVPKMIEIIKRPVAMNSNLHDAIFRPETLDMWCADAGRKTVACDEPYAHLNLADLRRFYENAKAPRIK
jgi:hypothetical protein